MPKQWRELTVQVSMEDMEKVRLLQRKTLEHDGVNLTLGAVCSAVLHGSLSQVSESQITEGMDNAKPIGSPEGSVGI